MAASSGGGPPASDLRSAVFSTSGLVSGNIYYRNTLQDSDSEDDHTSVVSWASETAPVGARVTTTDTTGLRRVCCCLDETTVRALYLRRAVRPRPLQRWRHQYPWVARIFAAVISGSEPEPRGSHETFRALWAYTLARAFQRAEATGVVFTGPTDPAFRVLLGETLEYTPVQIPFPIPSDLRSCAYDFYGHQRALMSHMARVDRAGYLTPCESIPSHLTRPPSPCLQVMASPVAPAGADPVEEPTAPSLDPAVAMGPMASGGCLDVEDSPPSSEGFVVPGGDRDDVASNHSAASNLSVAAPVFSPQRPPPGFERDETSLAGVRPLDPARPRPRSAPPSISDEKGVQQTTTPSCVPNQPEPAEPSPPPPESVRPDGVAQWVAEAQATTSAPTLLPSMGPRRPFGVQPPTRNFAAQTPKKLERRPEREGRRVRRARRSMRFGAPPSQGDSDCELKDPPRTVSPEYRPQFYEEEGPVCEEIFRRVAGAVGECDPDQIPCNHLLFQEAVSRKKISDPRRYCRHVRRGLAVVMMRHPSDWGIGQDTCQVLGAFVDREILPQSIATKGELRLDYLDYTDPAPIQTLQECYTVEVQNRFAPLFVDELETIENDLSDCDDLTASAAKAAQRRGKGAHPSGGPASAEGQRRKKRDQEERMSREQLQDIRKTRDQRKRDGKAALRRITAKIAGIDVRDIDVAKTVVVGHFSPAVRKLVEEHHHWLREPEEAYRRGKWYWAAACINNNVEPFIAATGLFLLVRGLGELCRATGSTSWVRDLCADGDVESNPGPAGVVNAPTDSIDVHAGALYWRWIEDRAGLSASPTDVSVDYLSRVTSRPSGYAEDVNDAVLVEGRWLRAVPSRGISFKADTWATTLYPTSIGDRAVRLANQNTFLAKDADAACHLDSVPHTAVPRPPAPTPSPSYVLQTPPGLRTPLRDEASTSSSSPSTAPPPGPTDEELRQQHIHPDPPDVILAALDSHGSVLRVTSSRGNGIALPLQGAGVLPRLAHNDARIMLIGRMREGVGVGGLHYATRHPITMLIEGDGPPVVRIDGQPISQEDSVFLRVLKTPESPSIMTPTGGELFLIGEWYPAEGNGASGELHHRSWSPPKFAFTAQTGVVVGTSLSPTATGTEERRDVVTRPVLVPRTEITALGIDKTTAERLSMMPIAWSTTCEANALKLGLMLDWARYGEEEASHMNVFTGQAQVHEPRVHVARDTTVTRLFNASGFPREDCGGMVMPCFPFHERWRRGKLKFFATAQLVPRGQPYLVLPACFDSDASFAEAAIFLLTFLPWPWGNMSIAVQTVLEGTAQKREQIYAWHGTTTAVPGSMHLNIVLHQLNVGEFVSGRSTDLELGSVPRMGPAPVEFWPGDVPIPVICKPGQHFYVPAAAFAASWACGFGVRDIKAVITKICTYGLFDRVERWILEGPCIARTHAGIMTVRRAKMDAEAVIEPSPDKIPPIMFDIVNSPVDELIPLMYRCWAASGNQMEHIPHGASWSDVRLVADAQITLPDIMSLTMVYSGFWKFDTHMHIPRPEVDWRLLSGAQFLNCERLFVAWHMWHSMIGLDVGTLCRAARSELPGRGESEYYDCVFGFGASEHVPALGNLLRLGLEKVLGGPLLQTVQGVNILQRMLPPRVWSPQVIDLTAVLGLDKVCPTPLTDIYVYKYVSEVPKAWQPFRVAYNGVYNMDIFPNETIAVSFPPDGNAGTFIWSDTNRFQDVDLDDIFSVRDHELWLNRLLHSYDEYQLREFRDGNIVAGAPPPGYAPVALVRGEDSWGGPTPRFWTETPPYPFFSTVWSSWMSCVNHRVLTLQCPLENATQWYELMNGPSGARSSGVVFDVVLQPSIAMPSKAAREKRWLSQMIKASENAGGGGVLGKAPQTPSNVNLSVTDDDPPQEDPVS
nr:MAG: polyprotein [Totiviridae sp.]